MMIRTGRLGYPGSARAGSPGDVPAAMTAISHADVISMVLRSAPWSALWSAFGPISVPENRSTVVFVIGADAN
jgi:hypothetical protein